MKKPILVTIGLLALLGTTTSARAQAALLQSFSAGTRLVRYANQQSTIKRVTNTDYRGKPYSMQRTPANRLPKLGADVIIELEAQLDRCNRAMLADSTSLICLPEQRIALQSALANLVRARLRWSVQAYQQEADFYFAEDTQRQQAALPATSE